MSWLGGVGDVDENPVEFCCSAEDDVAIVCDQVTLSVEPSHLFGAAGEIDETGGYVGWGVLDLGVNADEEEEGEREKGKEFGVWHEVSGRRWRRKMECLFCCNDYT